MWEPNPQGDGALWEETRSQGWSPHDGLLRDPRVLPGCPEGHSRETPSVTQEEGLTSPGIRQSLDARYPACRTARSKCLLLTSHLIRSVCYGSSNRLKPVSGDFFFSSVLIDHYCLKSRWSYGTSNYLTQHVSRTTSNTYDGNYPFPNWDVSDGAWRPRWALRCSLGRSAVTRDQHAQHARAPAALDGRKSLNVMWT